MSRLLLYRLKQIKYKFYTINVGQITKLIHKHSKNWNTTLITEKILQAGRLNIYEKIAVFFDGSAVIYDMIAVYIPYYCWPEEYISILEHSPYKIRNMIEKTIQYSVLDNFYYLSNLYRKFIVIGYAWRLFTKENIRMGRAMLVNNISLKLVNKKGLPINAIAEETAIILFGDLQDVNLARKNTAKIMKYLFNMGSNDVDSIFNEKFKKDIQKYKV